MLKTSLSPLMAPLLCVMSRSRSARTPLPPWSPQSPGLKRWSFRNNVRHCQMPHHHLPLTTPSHPIKPSLPLPHHQLPIHRPLTHSHQPPLYYHHQSCSQAMTSGTVIRSPPVHPHQPPPLSPPRYQLPTHPLTPPQHHQQRLMSPPLYQSQYPPTYARPTYPQ